MPWISSKDSPDLTATDAMPLTLALWGCGIPFHLSTPLVSWWHFEWRTWQQILLSFTSSRKEIFQFFPDLSGNNKWFYPFSSPPQCSWCRIWKSTSSRNKLSCLWVKWKSLLFLCCLLIVIVRESKAKFSGFSKFLSCPFHFHQHDLAAPPRCCRLVFIFST